MATSVLIIDYDNSHPLLYSEVNVDTGNFDEDVIYKPVNNYKGAEMFVCNVVSEAKCTEMNITLMPNSNLILLGENYEEHEKQYDVVAYCSSNSTSIKIGSYHGALSRNSVLFKTLARHAIKNV